MAFSVITNTIAQSTDDNSVTTSSINTSGSDLLVVGVADWQQATKTTLSDNKSNTWNVLTENNAGLGARLRIFYAKNPTVGSGHTFTATGTGTYPAISVLALSGAHLTSPFDQQNTNYQSGFGITITPGSVTPTEDNEILITIAGANSEPNEYISINSGFTISDHVPFVTGVAFGLSMAYLIETTATAQNPSWSNSDGDTQRVANIATFKIAASGAVTYRHLLPSAGVGR